MNKYMLYMLSILFCCLVSCEEEISSISLVDQKPVVQAYLYANQPLDSIRVTKSIAYALLDELEVIDDLEIQVSNEDESFMLDSDGNGYYSNKDHIVTERKNYSISFIYEGVEVSSSTYIQETIDINLSDNTIFLEKIEDNGGFPTEGFGGNPQVVDITWNNQNSDYYFVDIENTKENPELVNEYLLRIGDLPESFFRTEPEILDIYSINSRRELQTYGTFKITVYRLNPDYAALYQTIGSSTLSLQEPPTNVINGLGIFTGVTANIKFLEVKKI